MISESDLAFFETLPIAAQHELLQWRAQMRAIAKAGEGGRRDGRQGEAAASAAVILGVSVQTINRRYYAWQKYGDCALIDGRKVSRPAPEPGVGQRQPFIEYWNALCQRGGKHSISRAYNDLLKQWREGKDIPGYDFPPPAGHSGHPVGWSLKNLTRIRNKSRSLFLK